MRHLKQAGDGVTEWQPRTFESCSHVRFCLEPNPGPVEHRVYVLLNDSLILKNGCCVAF